MELAPANAVCNQKMSLQLVYVTIIPPMNGLKFYGERVSSNLGVHTTGARILSKTLPSHRSTTVAVSRYNKVQADTTLDMLSRVGDGEGCSL